MLENEEPQGPSSATPAPEAKKPAPKAKKAPAKKAPSKPRKPTVAGVIRRLVKAKRTNAQIWPVIKKQFKLSDEKKHYPAWYRGEMKRKPHLANRF